MNSPTYKLTNNIYQLGEVIQRMPRGLIGFIPVIIMFFTFSVALWATEISIETHHIPTIINGITTSIALIVGFNLTALTILISKLSEYYSETTRTIDCAFLFGIPIVMVMSAYLALMTVEYQLALKLAFTGLTTAFLILFPSLIFFGKKLRRKERELEKTKQKP